MPRSQSRPPKRSETCSGTERSNASGATAPHDSEAEALVAEAIENDRGPDHFVEAPLWRITVDVPDPQSRNEEDAPGAESGRVAFERMCPDPDDAHRAANDRLAAERRRRHFDKVCREDERCEGERAEGTARGGCYRPAPQVRAGQVIIEVVVIGDRAELADAADHVGATPNRRAWVELQERFDRRPLGLIVDEQQPAIVFRDDGRRVPNQTAWKYGTRQEPRPPESGVQTDAPADQELRPDAGAQEPDGEPQRIQPRHLLAGSQAAAAIQKLAEDGNEHPSFDEIYEEVARQLKRDGDVPPSRDTWLRNYRGFREAKGLTRPSRAARAADSTTLTSASKLAESELPTRIRRFAREHE
jgi:hypothetical protein